MVLITLSLDCFSPETLFGQQPNMVESGLAPASYVPHDGSPSARVPMSSSQPTQQQAGWKGGAGPVSALLARVLPPSPPHLLALLTLPAGCLLPGTELVLGSAEPKTSPLRQRRQR